MTDEREADICVDGPESRPLSESERIEVLEAHAREMHRRIEALERELTELSKRL